MDTFSIKRYVRSLERFFFREMAALRSYDNSRFLMLLILRCSTTERIIKDETNCIFFPPICIRYYVKYKIMQFVWKRVAITTIRCVRRGGTETKKVFIKVVMRTFFFYFKNIKILNSLLRN